MRRLAIPALVTAVYLSLATTSSQAGRIRGRLFNLPTPTNPSEIEQISAEDIGIEVRRAPGGLRSGEGDFIEPLDARGNRFPVMAPGIAPPYLTPDRTRLITRDGTFDMTIPDPDPGRLAVNIKFFRSRQVGNVVIEGNTQTLRSVIFESRPAAGAAPRPNDFDIDVSVPRPDSVASDSDLVGVGPPACGFPNSCAWRTQPIRRLRLFRCRN
jgi:hypothetical protein